MERYKSSIRNLAHIFLDSIGWETYFNAVVDSLDITPIESQLQAQGVPVRFEIRRGYITSASYSGNYAIFQLRIDGGATVRAPEAYSNMQFRASTGGADPWMARYSFVRDLAVRVLCANPQEAIYAATYYCYGTSANPGAPIWFETVDKPNGFIYSAIKLKYYQWFLKNEKIAHVPSLNGLKRLLHILGVKGLGINRGVRNTTASKLDETEQFTRLGRVPEGFTSNQVRHTDNVVRYSNAMISTSFGTVELILEDLTVATASALRKLDYYYVDMHKMNVRRGDRQILENHPEGVSGTYTIQGADKDMVMFDPNNNDVWNKVVVSINKDANTAFTTATTPASWPSAQLPALRAEQGGGEDPRKTEGINQPYVQDTGKSTDPNLGNLTAETDNSLPDDTNWWTNWAPNTVFTNKNTRGYTYPPPRDTREDHTQRLIILSASGGLGQTKLYRDRFILKEYVSLLNDYRTCQGIAWDKISLNLNYKNPLPTGYEPYQYLSSEQLRKFVVWYLEEYCNWKMTWAVEGEVYK